VDGSLVGDTAVSADGDKLAADDTSRDHDVLVVAAAALPAATAHPQDRLLTIVEHQQRV
jgi:hypothetical protein